MAAKLGYDQYNGIPVPKMYRERAKAELETEKANSQSAKQIQRDSEFRSEHSDLRNWTDVVSKGAGAVSDVITSIKGGFKLGGSTQQETHNTNSAKRYQRQNYIKVNPKTGEIYE